MRFMKFMYEDILIENLEEQLNLDLSSNKTEISFNIEEADTSSDKARYTGSIIVFDYIDNRYINISFCFTVDIGDSDNYTVKFDIVDGGEIN